MWPTIVLNVIPGNAELVDSAFLDASGIFSGGIMGLSKHGEGLGFRVSGLG